MRTRASLAIVTLFLAGACSSGSSPPIGSTAAAVGSFPGCSGTFNTAPSPTGSYYATDFGCSSDPYFTDSGDACGSAACIQSAYDEGVCPSGESNADCQRAVNWYSIGGASYGCGARLEVSNPANGKSVIVMVLDNGPSCTVENEAGYWVLDVSYPTIMYLFGSEEGYSDHALIQVAVVGASSPLGPSTGGAGTSTTTTTPDAGYGSCTTASGASGECIATSACTAEGGTATADDCPGPEDIQCCVKKSKGSTTVDAGSGKGVDAGYGSCTTASGVSGECIATSACAAEGGTATADDCPGPEDIQCCVKATKGSTTVDAGYGSCTTATGASGECIDTSDCAAKEGTSTADDCPGPESIQCCTGGT